MPADNVTRTENDVLAAILALFPRAEVAADDDGQLVINTGCMWTGKNGGAIMGMMAVAGETPAWEEV